LALAAAVVAALILVVGQGVHNLQLIPRLRHASPAWLWVCAAGEIVAYAGIVGSYRAFAASSDGPRLPVRLAIRVVGLSFGAFAVTSAIGGLSVDFWALREAGEPALKASARIIGLETLRIAVLALIATAAGVLSLAGDGHHVPRAVPIAWVGVTAACFLIAFVISSPRRSAHGDRPPTGLRGWLGVAVGGVRLIRRLVRFERRLRGQALLGSLAFWAGELACAWAALRAFHAHIGVVPLVLGYATGYMSTAIPLPLGGAGGIEAAFTAGFALAGAPAGSALLAALAFRLFSFWIPVAMALVALATVRTVRERLHEVAQARAAGAQPSG
jgi:uncharacterized membrane protein YbhN (UPF0104 family)